MQYGAWSLWNQKYPLSSVRLSHVMSYIVNKIVKLHIHSSKAFDIINGLCFIKITTTFALNCEMREKLTSVQWNSIYISLIIQKTSRSVCRLQRAIKINCLVRNFLYENDPLHPRKQYDIRPLRFTSDTSILQSICLLIIRKLSSTFLVSAFTNCRNKSNGWGFCFPIY